MSRYARRKRLEALRAQLPDAFELMSRILRAGQSVSQAMQAVSEEFRPPVNVEFGYCYEQQNLGLAPEVALHDLAQRTGLMEVKIFVAGSARPSPGRRQLDGTARQHRARRAAAIQNEKGNQKPHRRRANAGCRSARLADRVWFGLFFIARDYAMALVEHTSLLIATLTSMLIGTLWIRRIVNFDF